MIFFQTKTFQKILETIDKEYDHSNYKLAVNNESKTLPTSWEFIKIGRVEKFVGSGVTPKGGKSVYQDHGIPFIRSQNVHPDGLHLENIVYVDEELHNSMYGSHIQDGDVLLNITGCIYRKIYCHSK